MTTRYTKMVSSKDILDISWIEVVNIMNQDIRNVSPILDSSIRQLSSIRDK
jgi:hypothetical protein